MPSISAVVLGAVLTAAPFTAYPIDLSQEQQDVVMAAVKKQLKDPESARFTPLSVGLIADKPGEEVYMTCGFVNAKNSFGGYGGDAPFAASLMHGTKGWIGMVFAIGNDPSSIGAISSTCAEKGAPLVR